MATLETAILVAAKTALNNPKLTKNSIQEWSTTECKPKDDEVQIHLPDPGVYICVPKKDDKRKAKSV